MSRRVFNVIGSKFQDYQSADIGIQTAGATSQQLVLIMFNGLMDELVRARGHIEAKRYEHKANSINKCIDVLNALTGSLDFANGGELATVRPAYIATVFIGYMTPVLKCHWNILMKWKRY